MTSLVACAAVFCLLLLGCGERDDVRTYSVPTAPALRPEASAPVGGGLTSGPSRTLAAIIPRNETAWFFKLVGPEDAVVDQLDEFGALVRSVNFTDDGSPEWDLPENWDQQPASGMRFATLAVDADEALEVSVIPLPAEDADSDEYLLANFNRWRGEMGLPPVSGDDWMQQAEAAGELSQVDAPAGEATIINLAGTRQAGGMTPPFAGGMGQGRQATQASEQIRPPAQQSSVEVTAPAAWTRKEPGAFQDQLFVAGEDESVQISVSRAGGGLGPNVNRWRGQVGLGPLDDDQLEDALEDVTVGGANAKYVEIIGADKAIYGVIVPQGRRQVFFKMTGDPEATAEQRDAFREFATSADL